jgi:hypothetical protein
MALAAGIENRVTPARSQQCDFHKALSIHLV